MYTGTIMTTYKTPPFELHPFQWHIIEDAIQSTSKIMGADCGMGKGVMSIFVACWLYDNGLIDHILLECEKNKFNEWKSELARYSTFSVAYLDTPKGRDEAFANPPEVLLGVYETVRNYASELAVKSVEGRERKSWVTGPLTESLAGKRILWIADEGPAKLGASRSSAIYKSHEKMLKDLRKAGSVRALSLTATYINRDPLGFINFCRLMDPHIFPRIVQAEEEHVVKDQFNNPIFFKNLDENDTPAGQKSLKEKTSHLIIFKRKTDPDVIHLFPKIEPSFEYVRMGNLQRDFYNAVLKKAKQSSAFEGANFFSVLRMIAAHPYSVVRSVDNAIAGKKDPPALSKYLVDTLGRDTLAVIPSAKVDRLIEIIQSSDEPAVVFTFFGQSVLPLIHQEFEKNDIKTSINHGSLNYTQRVSAQSDFNSGRTQVFLTSDAGARGINLPAAGRVFNFDVPLTYANWWQRVNRANRLDSQKASTNIIDMVVQDSIEEGILELGLKRHAWSDSLTPEDEDSPDYLSAAQRREIMNFTKDING